MSVVLIGRIAIDFNPTDYYNSLDKNKNFNMYLGGSPANIAVSLARLDIDVEFIGKVSNDQFGDFVVNYFKENGISTKGIVRATSGEKLGLTFTEMKSEVESSILMYRDSVADLALQINDIDESIFDDAQYFVVSGTALASSPSREAVLYALSIAKLRGVKIIFDIDYRPYSWESIDVASLYYGIVAREANIIIGSREEFDLTEKFYLTNNSDDKMTAKYLLEGDAELVVIKHGKEGSFAYTKEETLEIKPFNIKAIKGFGGGDGYAGALIAGLIKGNTLEDALFYATVHAAILVASHSCSEDMRNEEEIKKYIEHNNISREDLVRRV